MMIGHRTLRTGVVGFEHRPATDAEVKDMVRWLEQSLDEGGRGLSTGLIYAPSMFADQEELTTLAETTARRVGLYTSHMRNEAAQVLEAIDEATGIGRRAGIRVQISHLKVSGHRNWGLIDSVLGRIRRARAEGQEVAADRYPYRGAHTSLDVVMPDWAAEGGREETLKRLADPSVRGRVREDLIASRPDDYWATVTIAATRHPDNRRFQGVPLLEAAAQLGLDPVDAILHVTEKDEMKTGAFFFGMNEDNMMRILAEPYVMIGSDASCRAPTGPLAGDFTHPRTYGTFARFLRMALDGRTVPVEEAVRKMTSLPAGQFGLSDRGVIAGGKKADIVVFDPGRVKDRADYASPHQLAEGMDYVVVNGVVTVSDGALTGDRAGQVL
jgi:N-acyl-D-amino-acid deacylase